jgi:hypothetical protein
MELEYHNSLMRNTYCHRQILTNLGRVVGVRGSRAAFDVSDGQWKLEKTPGSELVHRRSTPLRKLPIAHC